MGNVFLMVKIHDCLGTTTDTKPARALRNWTIIGELIPKTLKMGIIRAYLVGTLSDCSNGLLKLKNTRTIALRKPFLQVFPHSFSVVDVYYIGCNLL
jgi:hypothetical protein